jgi:hypothetical protein
MCDGRVVRVNRAAVQRVWRCCNAIWIALIILGSISPMQVKVKVGTETTSTLQSEQQKVLLRHHAGHILTFGVGAVLLTGCFRRWPKQLAANAGFWALGIGLELLQYNVMSSPYLETWDMRDDGIGIAAGFALATATRLGNRLNVESAPEPVTGPPLR